MDSVSIYNFDCAIVCSTAEGSILNFIPVLYPERFMLCKKAVNNGLSQQVYIPFSFQLRIQWMPLFSFSTNLISDSW